MRKKTQPTAVDRDKMNELQKGRQHVICTPWTDPPTSTAASSSLLRKIKYRPAPSATAAAAARYFHVDEEEEEDSLTEVDDELDIVVRVGCWVFPMVLGEKVERSVDDSFADVGVGVREASNGQRWQHRVFLLSDRLE